MKKGSYLPVAVSVLVIILVALLQNQSQLVAAVTATMPTKVPLALWVVYAANQGKKEIMESFSRSMVISIIPSFGFLLAAWLAASAGWRLIPTLLAGYAVWGAGIGTTVFFRRFLQI
jgi:predicted neutral ceramidase superfamily lipid hydrolase